MKLTQPKQKNLRSRIANAIGKKFHRLTVLQFSHIQNGDTWVTCRCACGAEHKARLGRLESGRTKSCGCFRLSPGRPTHGKSGTKIYRTWFVMLERCRNPKRKDYKNYGGRGVSVCEEWKTFKCFYSDMGDVPKGKQIDRIDNNGGYCKDNCRWATPRENCNNKRSNHWVEAFGERLTIAQWAMRTNVAQETICARIRRGWEPERAIL